MLYETVLRQKKRERARLLLVILVVNLSLDGVATLAVGHGLVLQSKLGEVTNDVLHLGVVVVALFAANVGKRGDGVEEVVDDGDDDGNTDGVAPDNDNGDDVGVAFGVRTGVVWRRRGRGR
jgi:hypothetical protein